MTVQYSLQAATATGLSFLRLLLQWRGSVWKLVVIELIIWAVGCIMLAMIYLYFIKSSLSVLLGFTAQTCMKRWMDVYNLLVWPENFALMFNSWFFDEALAPATARAVRHSIYRYLLLAYILLLRDVSISVKKQFPTYKHLIDGKLLTKEELEVLDSANINANYCRYWIPLLWTSQILKKYYRPRNKKGTKERGVMDEEHYGKFVREVCRIRGMLGDILSYDWIPIPLASTQTTTFAVYCYLVVDCILQHSPICLHEDLNITALSTRFTFSLLLNTVYLGWLKCSQVILNPFGLDDDDYEAGSLIDMYQRSLAGILTRPESTLPIEKSIHYRLPHTVGSALVCGSSETSLVGSMANKTMPSFGQEIIHTT
ncbi:Bestrophin [Dictyocaulus viviparus]|uniref:Bestrophin homolog n=1 Tax=Dictyocaulus viviparus TaxID=29172 RepID=A0A0D8YBF2_DICVI|nr:Bestrophin [Dictyocaulus viviparus]